MTIVAAGLLALAGCAKPAEVPSLNNSMRAVMEPEAENIWDLVSKAYNDVGDGLTPAKISDADWKSIAQSSARMRDRIALLMGADHVLVAKKEEPILGSQAVGLRGLIGKDWDAVSAATIQGRIDGNPALFKQKAQVLLDAATDMNRAAQIKDAALLYRVASGLDEVCDGCHEPFWGTDEPPPVSHKDDKAADKARTWFQVQ